MYIYNIQQYKQYIYIHTVHDTYIYIYIYDPVCISIFGNTKWLKMTHVKQVFYFCSPLCSSALEESQMHLPEPEWTAAVNGDFYGHCVGMLWSCGEFMIWKMGGLWNFIVIHREFLMVLLIGFISGIWRNSNRRGSYVANWDNFLTGKLQSWTYPLVI